MKVLERVAENFLRQQVDIDDMQFGFMPGHSTTGAIFIARQLQGKFYAINKTLCMAFVDLEKAFDRVPRRIIWWALHKLGVDEWLVRLMQSMYENARSRVRVVCNLSGVFSVKVGVHQGSCLSSLLFIMVLEALSEEFRTECPEKTCMQITWSSSLNRYRNYNSSWFCGRPTRKERDFGSTWTKPRSWHLGWSSMRFRSMAKTPVACVSKALALIPFSVVVVPVGSTRNTVASLTVWSLMPASDINSALGRPDQ